jgi:predicted RNA-binding protein with PUA-like domain
MARAHWLVKSEPNKYAWDDLVRDGSTWWDGVRNYQARNNLRDMRVGDRVLYYHSNEGKQIVGVARVTKRAYQDPTSDDDRWLVVDLAPLKALRRPVTLEQIKQDAALAQMPLVTQSRLSVMPISASDFERVLKLGGTALR